jgi:hypothetical protein
MNYCNLTFFSCDSYHDYNLTIIDAKVTKSTAKINFSYTRLDSPAGQIYFPPPSLSNRIRSPPCPTYSGYQELFSQKVTRLERKAEICFHCIPSCVVQIFFLLHQLLSLFFSLLLYCDRFPDTSDWWYYATVFLIHQTETSIPRQRLGKRSLSLHTNS